MTETLLHQGIEALRSGDKRRARRIFAAVVNEEPDNAAAWWYLAAVAADSQQKLHCLKQVIRLRPDHEEASQLLRALERRVATPSRGSHRPVLDTDETPAGVVITRDLPRPALPTSPAVERDPHMRHGPNITLTSVLVLLVVAGLVYVIVALWSGRLLAAEDNAPRSSPQALGLAIEGCSPTGSDGSELVFTNYAPVSVELLRGLPGEEDRIEELQSGEQVTVRIHTGLRIRYAVSTTAEGFVGTGAYFEISEGNSCRVPIR